MMRFCIRLFFICACFFVAGTAFSLGKIEKTPERINPVWTLCVTEFDVSRLPKSRAATGGVITRQIVNRFDGLKFKLRPVNEYDYYWQAAWLREQSAAAKQIIAKQAERDKLIYSGEPDWKISAAQRRLDGEIKTLRVKFNEAELVSPNIASAPEFTVTKDNRAGNFPAPPRRGMELLLCSQQKSDGLLFGKVSEYHGRILVELRFWSLWAKEITYEDKALFSIEDMGIALDEFFARLINSISGIVPATIVVKAEPSNAVIIIDEHHAGRGKSEVVERTPGEVEVTVYAEDHVTATEKIKLDEGEQVEAEFTLKSLPSGEVEVKTKNEESAAIYSGALFMGETPNTLRGQIGHYKQINIETPSGGVAQTLFRIEKPESKITLIPKTPPPDGRIEKARKGFYGALGRLWIIGPAAFLSAGYSNLAVDAFVSPYSNRTTEHFNNQQFWYNLSTGFMIATAAVGLEVLIRLGIYIYQGNRESAIFKSKNKAAAAKEPDAPSDTETITGETEGGENAANGTSGSTP
ncbi:MAG: PEGA domain-containing protein [Spirochaetaceae bacterium]|nr:PEGA domain-containing protein [Spirochaetaceae bacterium]